ncbi:hypothetical protein AS594_02340 [Streptomyces agglomeratus]|uniref:Transposase IS4-like domain-containing protein n=1 Tax=Streptomyces agglomeratus TaxID=285458 RepID=A0A1E5P1T1_9ACTN|nr:hypothetical protein AS594_02340 [Streptomyces agglomeratus]OEJ54988.1 hypothetical protein BGK72_33545 [Streptomyces agglomeratus]
MGNFRIIRTDREGRARIGKARTRPDRVVADKGYSARKICGHLRRRSIAAALPERIDRIKGRTAQASPEPARPGRRRAPRHAQTLLQTYWRASRRC